MQDNDQVFDRPVEAFMADSNILKWLNAANTTEGLVLETTSPLSTDMQFQRREVAAAVKSALAAWDPNQGPEQEERVRERLEQELEAISARVVKRLTKEQLQVLREQQRRHMGYAYLFVAAPDELMLSAEQRQELSDRSSQAAKEADVETRREMSSVQIRNPQAYLAYKLRKLYEETHKRRVILGKEFYEKTLSQSQRAQLPF